jgi:hypothetical protein
MLVPPLALPPGHRALLTVVEDVAAGSDGGCSCWVVSLARTGVGLGGKSDVTTGSVDGSDTMVYD